MKEIFVYFTSSGKCLSYDDAENYKSDDLVLVETDQIIEEGKVVKKPHCPELSEKGTGKILRNITLEDNAWREYLKKTAKETLALAREKTVRHGLNMKILDAELSFDQKKLTFYFSAQGRVDFRSLVSDLAKSFNKLIRLQQVSSREEARHFGGFGKCGRELCCAKFLRNSEAVTLAMAESQELANAGSGKLTGCCGKLMCCISYEAENYDKLKKKMPKMGSDFQSPQGSGKVVGYNILESKVILETKDNKKIEVLV